MFAMAEVQSYVVHNTFVELVDNAEAAMTGSTCTPAFRRRRGSSFFRCSSEPLTSSRHQGCCADAIQDACSTEAGGSTCASSRATSPDRAVNDVWQHAAPGIRMPDGQWQPQYTAADLPPTMGTLTMFGFHTGQTVMMPAMQSQPPCNTSISLFTQQQSKVTAESNSACHLIWCDHRAFKDSSAQLKQQLEARSGAAVKTHKTADNCIRLFRKKQRAQGRPPCVILVSWTNAPALLQYLKEAGSHVNAKVVVLCDARSCRKGDSVDDFSASYPNLWSVATTWEDALESVCNAVADSK